MSETIHLKYDNKPFLYSFITPFVALTGVSKRFYGKESIPHISVELKNQKIKTSHLEKFNEICGLKKKDQISLVYPLTHVFPFFQRILSLKKAPLNLFSVLGKNLRIERFKSIDLNNSFDIYCEISDMRVHEKGLDVDLTGIIMVDGDIVWKAVETFFYRGRFAGSDHKYEDLSFDEIQNPSDELKWFLPGKNGFRFALISGDGNPIHYLGFYAKLFGFKNSFAQPFLVLSKTVDLLDEENEANVLEAAFKGQFYYKKDVIIKSEILESKTRFDIYSEGNERPCMKGSIDE